MVGKSMICYADYAFPEQLTLYILFGRVFASGWKGFDFEGQIFTPEKERYF